MHDEIKCEMCQKEFDSVSPLESHLKECLDELKAFQCKLCVAIGYIPLY